jgi:AcrR family transcriptional regulator
VARVRDEQKREKILQTARVLFSQHGYSNTSISHIVQETGMPVGTIYTYFERKEDIIRTIIDVGWDEVKSTLEDLTKSQRTGQEKLKLIIDEVLPEILTNIDFINILLTEAIEFTKMDEKMEKITDIIFSIIREIPGAKEATKNLSRRMLQTSIVVVFLGILNTANLAKTGKSSIDIPDILAFLKHIVAQSLGVTI